MDLPLLLEKPWVFVHLCITAGENDHIVSWPVSKTIQIELRHQLKPLNAWSQTIEFKELIRPTSANFSTLPTIRYFSLKLMAISILTICTLRFLFLTPQYHLRSLLFFLFHQSISTPRQWVELSR